MRLSVITVTLISFFTNITSSTVLSPAYALQPRSDPGGPCSNDANCYGNPFTYEIISPTSQLTSPGGANCCFSICKLGSCTAKPGQVGGSCAKDGDCSSGVKCCSLVCKLGSCRMDGSCDADNDCYGWCHNNAASKCCIKNGKKEGTCNCAGQCTW